MFFSLLKRALSLPDPLSGEDVIKMLKEENAVVNKVSEFIQSMIDDVYIESEWLKLL